VRRQACDEIAHAKASAGLTFWPGSGPREAIFSFVNPTLEPSYDISYVPYFIKASFKSVDICQYAFQTGDFSVGICNYGTRIVVSCLCGLFNSVVKLSA
jgi:hypothetical protein